jgi:predicted amidohydrolase
VEDVRVAAAQYPIELLPSFDAWADKISRWVAEASDAGAQLLLFPEYAAMELAGCDPFAASDLQRSLGLVMALSERADELHRRLATMYGLVIVGGSRPVRDDRGLIVNRARLLCPDGSTTWQDKIVMTRFEREIWGISGGTQIRALNTPFGPVGISICYDAEFPRIARAQAEAGARIILVPSATDTMQDYWRVRIGAQARTLESQCQVVQAPIVGLAPWLPSLDENYGAAAIYGPPDGTTPDNGVVAITQAQNGQWLFADLNLSHVAEWRLNGTVLPFRNWPEQTVDDMPLPADIANDNMAKFSDWQPDPDIEMVEGLGE